MRKGDFQAIEENVLAGQVVKRLRESLELTQSEFAGYVHLQLGIDAPTQPTVSAWEAGKATVPAALLVHAVNRFGVQFLFELLPERQERVNNS